MRRKRGQGLGKPSKVARGNGWGLDKKQRKKQLPSKRGSERRGKTRSSDVQDDTQDLLMVMATVTAISSMD